jgi:CBS domain-containing protein
MNIKDICTREVVTVRASDPLSEAARQMCDRHVGAVVVVEDRDQERLPVGIVTDRDIVRAQLKHAADLSCLSVGQVMTPKPLVLGENCVLGKAIEAMQTRTVRRAPVVNSAGALVGMISVDDLLHAIAQQLSALARLIEVQQRREAA